MEGPRCPKEAEMPQVLNFLNQSLRSDTGWSIASEYPTAITPQNIHNMRIISDGDRVLSHGVLKPLIIKSPHVIFKVAAIGSIVTEQNHRGQGLSTQIIQDCLTSAADQQCDIAILWTDIFDFYRRMGFELAGSEISFVIDDNFTVPQIEGLKFMKDNKVSAEAIHRIYSTHTVSSVRTVDEIRKFMSIPQTKIYTAWEANGQLAAYAIEGKGADLGGYIHEWGGSATKLMALFSYIRKESDKTITVICPVHSHNMIKHLEAKSATKNNGYLGMIKIVNFDQLSAKIKRTFRSEGVADFVLEKHADHYVFGIGSELFTLRDEKDLVRILFGPLDYKTLAIFSPENTSKIEKILPLNLWIWGWDSI